MSDGPEHRLAEEVFQECSRIPEAGSESSWEWIRTTLVARGPSGARPLSCGQFDLAALIFDFIRLRESVAKDISVFILIDNPEVYLHPAVQEPLLDVLARILPQAQVFLASHSLKLLCHRNPASVFWLSRSSADLSGHVQIERVRDLEAGARDTFFDLYGTDVSAAVLSLLRGFESPEYFRYLCDSALPPSPIERVTPATDRQMITVGKHVESSDPDWTILDCGAGHGDLLAAVLEWRTMTTPLTYLAVDPSPSSRLTDRVAKAIASGQISSRSGIFRNLTERGAPRDCDVAVLCNACHEIPLPHLPRLLARVLGEQLTQTRDGRIIIHEAETIVVGEAFCLLWTRDEYGDVFAGIPGIQVSDHREVLPGRVGLDTTEILRLPGPSIAPDLSSLLTDRFYELLERKKTRALDEIERLLKDRGAVGSLAEALRQRQVAFVTSQIASICAAERHRGGHPPAHSIQGD